MKKTLFVFTVAGALSLVSCNSAEEENNNNEETQQSSEENQDEEENSEPSIVGTWQQSGFDMGVEIPAEEQEMYEKTVKETIDNTKYTFNEDGSYKVNTWMLGKGVEYEGTYSIDGEKLMTTQDGEEVSFDFSVSDTELVLKQEDQGAVMTMTFERK